MYDICYRASRISASPNDILKTLFPIRRWVTTVGEVVFHKVFALVVVMFGFERFHTLVTTGGEDVTTRLEDSNFRIDKSFVTTYSTIIYSRYSEFSIFIV